MNVKRAAGSSASIATSSRTRSCIIVPGVRPARAFWGWLQRADGGGTDQEKRKWGGCSSAAMYPKLYMQRKL